MGPDELAEMVGVARRHYLDGVSRVDIAKERGISRFKVGRVLARALETGVVRIQIRGSADVDLDVSEVLRVRYGLRRALAVRTADESSVHDALGRVASELLAEIVTEKDVLGLDCGRTLRAMTQYLHGFPRCDLVQLTGMAGTAGETSVDICRAIAEVNHGDLHPLYAPIVVPDARTARMLREQPSIRSTMERYPSVTTAVIAIGAWEDGLSQVRELVEEPQRGLLGAAGVVGETCALLLDADGAPVPGLEDRRLGVTAEQLRGIGEVVGVAGGAGKTAAVRSVLHSGHLTTLVTDVHLARRLLDAG